MLESFNEAIVPETIIDVREVFPMAGEFVRVASRDDLRPGDLKSFMVGGQEVCLINADGEYFAISNECTHAYYMLNEGTLEGYELECMMHGSRFDVRTGEPTNPPAEEPVKTFQVKVEGDDIFVAL